MKQERKKLFQEARCHQIIATQGAVSNSQVSIRQVSSSLQAVNNVLRVRQQRLRQNFHRRRRNACWSRPGLQRRRRLRICRTSPRRQVSLFMPKGSIARCRPNCVGTRGHPVLDKLLVRAVISRPLSVRLRRIIRPEVHIRLWCRFMSRLWNCCCSSRFRLTNACRILDHQDLAQVVDSPRRNRGSCRFPHIHPGTALRKSTNSP